MQPMTTETRPMTAAEEKKLLKARIAELEAGVPTQKLEGATVKVGEKGNILIYGLQRFPFCFYKNQIIKLKKILNSPEFEKFLADNDSKLSVKSAE